MTERPALAGITPILATSYRDDGRIALDDIERQVDHLAGLASRRSGSGSEATSCVSTDAERDELVRTVAHGIRRAAARPCERRSELAPCRPRPRGGHP